MDGWVCTYTIQTSDGKWQFLETLKKLLQVYKYPKTTAGQDAKLKAKE